MQTITKMLENTKRLCNESKSSVGFTSQCSTIKKGSFKLELENTYEHCDISSSECTFLIWLLFAALTSMLNQWLRLAVWLALLPRRVHACVFPFRICYNVYEYIYIFHFWTVSLTAHERFEWRTKRCRVVVPRIRLRVRPGWLFVVSPPLFAYKYMYNMAYIVYIYIYSLSRSRIDGHGNGDFDLNAPSERFLEWDVKSAELFIKAFWNSALTLWWTVPVTLSFYYYIAGAVASDQGTH